MVRVKQGEPVMERGQFLISFVVFGHFI